MKSCKKFKNRRENVVNQYWPGSEKIMVPPFDAKGVKVIHGTFLWHFCTLTSSFLVQAEWMQWLDVKNMKKFHNSEHLGGHEAM